MKFTADQIRAIGSQMTESGTVSAPRAVLLATAALMGEDSTLALICHPESHENSTTWRVVCLLDSGCLFTIDAVGKEVDWDYDSFHDEQGHVEVELWTRIRSVSDVASLRLTSAKGYDPRNTNNDWDVLTTWEICWRDGSPSVTLPTRANPTGSEVEATDMIVEKVRQVLAAR